MPFAFAPFTIMFVAIVMAGMWYAQGLRGGWSRLARTYRRKPGPNDATRKWQTVSFFDVRIVPETYSPMVSLSVNEAGVDFALPGPLSFGHPPVTIPYAHFVASPGKRYGFDVFYATAHNAPGLRILLNPKQVKWIEANALQPWQPVTEMYSSEVTNF